MDPSAPPARSPAPQTPPGPPKHVALVMGSKNHYGSSVQPGSGPHTCPWRALSLQGHRSWQLSRLQPGSAEPCGAEHHPGPSTKSTPGQGPSCGDTAAGSQIISTASFRHPPPCSGSALPPRHLLLLFIAWRGSGTPAARPPAAVPHPHVRSRKGHRMGRQRVKNAFNGHICFGLNPRALVTRQLGAPRAHMAPGLPG